MAKMIDLTGNKYGQWKILRRDEEKDKSGFVIWLLECKCGKQRKFRSSQIIHNRAAKQCGCEKDWTGKKFGRLTVLKKISGLGNHAAKILCKCECGNEKIVWGGSLHQGSVRSCGCLKSVTQEHRCITITIRSYIGHAKRRGIPFNLTREEFLNLCLQECFYCKGRKSNITQRKTKYQGILRLEHNGIDRIDSTKGYDIENCVPCCKICNWMKRSFSVDEWISHMRKVLEQYKSEQKKLGE